MTRNFAEVKTAGYCFNSKTSVLMTVSQNGDSRLTGEISLENWFTDYAKN